jgi:hypothetical protein
MSVRGGKGDEEDFAEMAEGVAAVARVADGREDFRKGLGIVVLSGFPSIRKIRRQKAGTCLLESPGGFPNGRPLHAIQPLRERKFMDAHVGMPRGAVDPLSNEWLNH